MDDIQELYFLFPDIKDHICIEKKVGQGTFSYVYSGYFYCNENEKVALKYIIPTSSPSRTKQEIECLLNIGGRDNVVGVLAVLRNKSHILILMPFIDHVAFHESFIYWDLEEVKDYIKNLLIALKRVHECGIIHRDVKPSNFLYDCKKKIYALVDFGLAQSYDKTCENIFDYEKSSRKSGSSKIDNTPIKHNMISVSKKNAISTSASHLVLANPKISNSTSTTNSLSHSTTNTNNNNNDGNSLPHVPLTSNKEKFQISNSISFDSNLKCLKTASSTTEANNKSSSPLAIDNHQQQQQQHHQQQQTNSTINKTATINQTSKDQLANSNTPIINKQTNNKQSVNSNFQKYHSFQKFYNLSDNKCNCFNMPFVCEICTTRNSKWAPRAGTAGFRAPEVLFRSTYQTPSVDIWSAGIIFLSILTGCYPFFKAVDDNMAIMQLISLFGTEVVRKTALKYGESLICSNEKKPTDLKEICVNLRKNVLKSMNKSKSSTSLTQSNENNNNNREHRCSSSLNNNLYIEFPDSAYDLLKRLLEMDCDKRICADEALKHSFFQI